MRKKKRLLLLITALLVVFFISGCDNGKDGHAKVYNTYSNADYAYKYPAEWIATEDHEMLNILQILMGDFYSSGSVAMDKTGNMGFLMICLDMGVVITKENLDEFMDAFIDSFKESNIYAVLKEDTYTTVDRKLARKVVLEDPGQRSDIYGTYKGQKLYLILCRYNKEEVEKAPTELFAEMVASIRLY